MDNQTTFKSVEDFLQYHNITLFDFGITSTETFVEKPLVKALVATSSFSITLLGLIGNLIICFIVASQRRMQTPLNLILVNLAIADILLAILIAFMDATYTFYEWWIFGQLACHATMYFLSLGEFFESLTIAVTFAVFLFYEQIHPRNCCFITGALWILAAIAAIPQGFIIDFVDNNKYVYCFDEWRLGRIIALIKFFVPFIAVSVSLILHKCVKKTFITENGALRMLLLLIVILFLLWAPIVFMKNIEHDHLFSTELLHFLFVIATLTSMFSIVYKPILYILIDKDFNVEFKKLMLSWFSRARLENYALHENL